VKMKFEINEIENAKLIIEIMNAGDAEEIKNKSVPCKSV